MIKYLIRQALAWAVRVFFATNLAFFVATAFLKPASLYAERRPPIPPEQIEAQLRVRNLSYAQPLLERWWNWLTGVLLHWNWGAEPTGSVGSVNQQIGYRVWISAQLMLGATVIAFVVGIAIAVYAASRQYKVGDRIVWFVSMIGLNSPVAVVAMVVVFAGIALNRKAGTILFYVSGSAGIDVNGVWNIVLDKAQRLTLPSIVLLFITFASYSLTQRSILLDNISADYVRLARAKGLRQNVAIRRHALRTSMIPVAVQFAYSLPGIFTGAVITETIFAWNGMGKYFYDSISKQNVYGAVAVAAFGAVMTAIGAMLSDVFVAFLDPRVRVS